MHTPVQISKSQPGDTSANDTTGQQGLFKRIISQINQRQAKRHSQAVEFYQLAQHYHNSNQFQQALQALDEATQLDNTYAAAYGLKARILLQSDDWHDWQQARREAEQAVKADWKEPEYHLLLGEVHEKQGSAYNASSEYKTAIRLDSSNVEAHYRLGRYYRNEMHFYGTMISVESPYQMFDANMLDYYQGHTAIRNETAYSAGMYNAQLQSPVGINISDMMISYDRILSERFTQAGMIRFDRFGEKYYRKATTQFEQTLRFDPNHWSSLIELGLLAYEAEDMDLLRQRLKEVQARAPENIRTLLFAGLASYALGEYAASDDYFGEAMATMDTDIRVVYETPQYILPAEGPHDQESSANIAMASNLVQLNYWHARDPLYLSEANERQLAHYARCAYADFRFSYPPRDIRGLRTDRGKVYVRYGEPVEIKRKRPESAGHYYEFWYYDDRTFCFEDPWGDGRTGYDLGRYYGIDFHEIARQEFQEDPDDYRLPTEGELWSAPCQIAGFRGEGNTTNLVLMYGVPVTASDLVPAEEEVVSRTGTESTAPGSYRATYTEGLFLFDMEFNDVIREVRTRTYARSPLPDSTRPGQIPEYSTVSIRPGEYNFSLEMVNERSGNVSIVRDYLLVPDFRGESLMLSDIMLASDILAEQEPITTRQDFTFTPNPSLIYQQGEQLHLYYEVYNLQRADPNGQTRFTVATDVSTVHPQRRGLGKIWHSMRGLLGLTPGERSVSLQQELRGNTSTEYQRSVIDISDWEPGYYRLTVTVTDQNADEGIQKGLEFRIIEPPVEES